MRVICPACEAIYDVPDARLGEGKLRVRCTRCEHEWEFDAAAPVPPPADAADAGAKEENPPPEVTAAPGAEAPQAPPPLVAEKRPRLQSAAAEPPRSGRATLLGWGLSLLVIVAAASVAVHFRAPIMHAWPASERAYGWFGIAPPPGPARN